MLQRFYAFLMLLTCTLLFSCFSTDDNEGPTVDAITIGSISDTEISLSNGHSKSVYFAFSASALLSEESVSLSIVSPVGTVADSMFRVVFPNFSLEESSLEDMSAFVTIKAKDNCISGTYTATLTALVGAVADSQTFEIKVDGLPSPTIDSIDVIQVTTNSSVDRSVYITDGEGLSSSDFSVEVQKNDLTQLVPTIQLDECSNGESKMTIDATGIPAGVYTATLTVGYSTKPFQITVLPSSSIVVTLENPSKDSLKFYPGQNDFITFDLSASMSVTDSVLTYRMLKSGVDVSEYFECGNYSFVGSKRRVTAEITAKTNCVSGDLVLEITAAQGAASSKLEIPVTVVGYSFYPIEAVEIASGEVSQLNARLLSSFTSPKSTDFYVSAFSVTDPSVAAPVVTVTAVNGYNITLQIDATGIAQGDYTGLIAIGSTVGEFTITVTETITLEEKSVKLYNPYAKDGFNSAYNMFDEVGVAGEVQMDGKMQYAGADSAVADFAVDNNLDIRATEVVAEVTSLNGGMFVNITKAEYDAASTSVALQALAQSKTFMDNEAIITVQDDIAVDGFYVMRLGNNRGYAVFQMAELNTADTEGSTGNTGYLKINYKHTAK